MSTALSFPTELFIDGEFRRGSDGRSLPQTNPATEEVFCEVAAAGAADVQSAVEGAHRAFTQGWRDLAPRKRADILFGIAKAIRDNLEHLAAAESRNIGKPIT